MANISRPSRRTGDEDGNSLKKKQLGGKSKDSKSSTASVSASATTFGLRRSSRETSSKAKKPTSQTTRKSERLEKQTLLTPAKRKLEQGKKQRIPSFSSSLSTKKSLSSGRGEKNQTSSSSNSKKSEKEVSTLKHKKKKQKKENVKPGKLETREESKSQKNGSGLLLRKGKRLDARTYRASFKSHMKKAEQSDAGEYCGRQDTLCQENGVKTGTHSSKKVRNVKSREKAMGKCSGGKEKVVEEAAALEVTSSASEELSDGTLLCDDGEMKLSCLSKKGSLQLAAKSSKSEGLDSKSMEDQLEATSITGSPEAASVAVTPDAATNAVSPEATSDAGSPEAASVAVTPDAATNAVSPEATSDAGMPEAVSDAGMVEADCSSGENLPELKSLSSAPIGNSQSYDNDLETVNESRPDKRKTNALDVDSEIAGMKKGIFSMGTSPGDANESSMFRNKDTYAKRCTACSKQLSVASGLEDSDACFCSTRTSHGLTGVTLSEDRGGSVQDNDNIRTTEGCSSSNHQKDSVFDTQTEHEHNVCFICKHGGKLLRCDGKGCSRSYHLPCLDPPLNDVPFGIWHCLHCMKKKIEFGVHAVSEGLESIWDVREVEGSDCDGMQKEKQYWVKYKGLAHVHNRWISEGQLLKEAPHLITKYNKRHQKEQAVRWKMEWTIPERLVRRRLVMPPTPNQLDKYFGGDYQSISGCLYEWFVKWKGLGYEHATWELENAPFLTSPDTKMLMIDYERRCKKAKEASDPSRTDQVLQEVKRSLTKLPKLPSDFTAGLDNDNINSISKLRECCCKCQNAVVVDEQERIMKVILLILSLQSYICRPFLIISTSSVLPAWEDEFSHLASSINVVVYGGNKDVRKCIRSLEFYEDGGCVMFQVLISSADAVVEDSEALSSLVWEAIIVDECQLPVMSRNLESIGTLMSDFRLLLISGQIKDSVSEYRKLLAFLDSSGVLGNDINDNACELAAMKDMFSCYILYEKKSVSSKFVEFWVPVRLSMVQLEQYCATLLENLISLRSCSKTDPVGAFRDILISTRKCCDHPYLVNPSLQVALTKGLPEVEYLDIGVNASSKLKLLDKILPEMKKQGLRVLILFQSKCGSGRNSIGDFLDDYMRQRFGPDSYERIDSGLATSKRHAALSMFNDKERGRFVFLIENRACHPSIKLSSVDIVIIFDSDWNPFNDLRSLQRINFDSQSKPLTKPLKVFRLYSSCTVEEKVLVFAKQDLTLDSNIQNINRSTSHMLLMWGASSLFDSLEKFHRRDSPCLEPNTSSEESLLNNVVLELLAQLAHDSETSDSGSCSVILKVKNGGPTYSRNISSLGELELQSTDEEQPHLFWAKLLEGMVPRWRYLTGSSQRSRKKVQYFDDLPGRPEAANDEARKKRKKMATIDSLSPKSSVENQGIPAASDKETRCVDSSGASGTQSYYESQHLPRSPANMSHKDNSLQIPPVPTEISESHQVHIAESCGRKNLRDEQKSLLLFLNPEISKLCEILQLPETVKLMAGRFLEYIINNHRVIREPETVFKAFQISLCWAAASFLKHKVDHKESLALVKQQLNFECKEEEAEQVYSILKKLKKRILREADTQKASISNSKESQLPTPRSDDVTRRTVRARNSEAMPPEWHVQKGNMCEISQRLSVDKGASDSELANSGASGHCSTIHLPSNCDENGSHELSKHRIKQIEEICARRTKEILWKQQQEIAEFNKIWDKKKEKLNKARMLAVDRIKAASKDHSANSQKLKLVEQNFARQLSELSKCMETYQKNLVEMQWDARNREKQIKAFWLEDAKSGRLSESFSKLPLSETGFRLDRAGFRLDRAETQGQRIVQNGSGSTILISGTSSVPNDINEVVPQVVDCASAGGMATEAPVEFTALGGVSAEASASRNEKSGTSAEASAAQNEKSGTSAEASASQNEKSGTSSIPNDINSVVPQVVDCTSAGGISTEAPVEFTVLGGVSAERSVGQNEAAKSLALGTRMIPLHSNSIKVGSSNSNRHDIAALRRGEVCDAPHLCQGGPSSLVPPDTCSQSQDHDKSHVAGVMQSTRPYNSDDVHQICSQPSQGVSLSLDQPQSSPRPNHPDAGSVRVDNYGVASLVPSSQQNQDEDEHSIMRAVHDDSVPSHQVASVHYNQPSISGRGKGGHVPSCEGLITPHQIEVSAPRIVDHTSACECQCNNNVLAPETVVQVHQQLSADIPSADHIQLDPSSASRTETETRDDGVHSLPQMEDTMQQADDNMHLQSEHAVSQPVTQVALPVYTNRPTGGMPMGDPQVVGTQLEPTGGPSLSFPTTTPRSQLLFSLDPLQNELVRLCREDEQATKLHEVVIKRLTADCDREVQEVRRKYNVLMGNCNKRFSEMKSKRGTYLNKLSMNLKLAEAFKTNFDDPKTNLAPHTRGLPAFSQQFSTQSLSQTVLRPLHEPAQSAQVAHRMPSLFSSNPANATNFSPIIPPRVNLQAGAELRAPAPHLQPFRPASASTHSHLPPASGMLNQQSVSGPVTAASQPPQIPARPLFVPLGGFGRASMPDNSTPLPAFHNSSLSALELLLDFDRRSGTSLQSPSDLNLSIDTLLPSSLLTGIGRDNAAGTNSYRPADDVDVVCLSDDD